MKETIYDIGGDLLALNALLNEVGGDVSGDGEAEIIDAWFKENAARLDTKLASYGALYKEHLKRTQVLREREKEVAELRKQHDTRAENLRARLFAFMQEHHMEHLEADEHKFDICGIGGKAPLLVSVEANELPEEYRKVEYKPDNDAIRAALESGTELPFASIGERGKYLRIK